MTRQSTLANCPVTQCFYRLTLMCAPFATEDIPVHREYNVCRDNSINLKQNVGHFWQYFTI